MKTTLVEAFSFNFFGTDIVLNLRPKKFMDVFHAISMKLITIYLILWTRTFTVILFRFEKVKASSIMGSYGGVLSKRSNLMEWSENDEGVHRRALAGGYTPPNIFNVMDDDSIEMEHSLMGREESRMISRSQRSSESSKSSPVSSGSWRGDDDFSPVQLKENEAEFEVRTVNERNHQVAKSEIELGKDKELFHFTLDFVRVWDVISRKSTWKSIAKKCMKTIAKVTGRDDYNVLFKELAVEMLGDIRRHDKGSPLKLFKGTIKQAEAFARGKGAFIIVYIEEATGREYRNSMTTDDSAIFRKALSDPDLGKVLNEEFVFFAGSTRHNPTFRLARQLGPFKKKDFPIFVALAPSYVDAPSKSAGVPEKLAVFGVPNADVDAKKIMQFLTRVKKIHGPTLESKQKEFLELLRSEDQEQQQQLQGE